MMNLMCPKRKRKRCCYPPKSECSRVDKLCCDSLSLIGQFLTVRDVYRWAMTCKALSRLMQSNFRGWKEWFRRDYGSHNVIAVELLMQRFKSTVGKYKWKCMYIFRHSYVRVHFGYEMVKYVWLQERYQEVTGGIVHSCCPKMKGRKPESCDFEQYADKLMNKLSTGKRIHAIEKGLKSWLNQDTQACELMMPLQDYDNCQNVYPPLQNNQKKIELAMLRALTMVDAHHVATSHVSIDSLGCGSGSTTTVITIGSRHRLRFKLSAGDDMRSSYSTLTLKYEWIKDPRNLIDGMSSLKLNDSSSCTPEHYCNQPVAEKMFYDVSKPNNILLLQLCQQMGTNVVSVNPFFQEIMREIRRDCHLQPPTPKSQGLSDTDFGYYLALVLNASYRLNPEQSHPLFKAFVRQFSVPSFSILKTMNTGNSPTYREVELFKNNFYANEVMALRVQKVQNSFVLHVHYGTSRNWETAKPTLQVKTLTAPTLKQITEKFDQVYTLHTGTTWVKRQSGGYTISHNHYIDWVGLTQSQLYIQYPEKMC